MYNCVCSIYIYLGVAEKALLLYLRMRLATCLYCQNVDEGFFGSLEAIERLRMIGLVFRLREERL